jgi:hypothetical protein
MYMFGIQILNVIPGKYWAPVFRGHLHNRLCSLIPLFRGIGCLAVFLDPARFQKKNCEFLPICSKSARVCEGAENQQISVAVSSEGLGVNL